MSSARDYERQDYQRPSTSAVVWLVCTLSAGFVLQLVLQAPWFGSGANPVNHLALTVSSVKEWHLWTLVTHSLVHDTAWPWSILFTVVGLIFVGRELEPQLGARRFVALYVGSVVFSALCWCAVHWGNGGSHFGAGAAIFAFLAVLSALNPDIEFTVFHFPVSFRLRLVVWTFLAVETVGLLFYEVPGARVPAWLSPSTHLGGMLAGWLYFRLVHARNGLDRNPAPTLPAWLKPETRKRPALVAPAAGASPLPGPRRAKAALRADVDRILDKINSDGFGSLSEEEKRTLDEAKDLLSKH